MAASCAGTELSEPCTALNSADEARCLHLLGGPLEGFGICLRHSLPL